MVVVGRTKSAWVAVGAPCGSWAAIRGRRLCLSDFCASLATQARMRLYFILFLFLGTLMKIMYLQHSSTVVLFFTELYMPIHVKPLSTYYHLTGTWFLFVSFCRLSVFLSVHKFVAIELFSPSFCYCSFPPPPARFHTLWPKHARDHRRITHLCRLPKRAACAYTLSLLACGLARRPGGLHSGPRAVSPDAGLKRLG